MTFTSLRQVTTQSIKVLAMSDIWPNLITKLHNYEVLWTLSSHQKFEYYFFIFFICFSNFSVKIVKQKLSQCHWSIIRWKICKVSLKWTQLGQKVSDIFWTCFYMNIFLIVSDKLKGLLISSFWSCDSDIW